MKQSNRTIRSEFNLRSRGPCSLLFVIVVCTLGHAANTALAQTCQDCTYGPDCIPAGPPEAPWSICPSDDPWRVHADFPVVHNWLDSWNGCVPARGRLWSVHDPMMQLPMEQDIRIDQAGGTFFWTPAMPVDGFEVFDVTIRVDTSQFDPCFLQQYGSFNAQRTFTAIVDQNSMLYPVWRDYRDEQDQIVIRGRATGTPGGGGADVAAGGFESYTIEYGEALSVQADAEPPGGWINLVFEDPNEHATEDDLAVWPIPESEFPDGGRYALRLTVNLKHVPGNAQPDPPTSVVLNQIIIDRSAMPGWPTRVASAIIRSPAIADIDDDGIDEVFAINRGSDSFHAWSIDGVQFRGEEPAGFATRSGIAVGDIDGDGEPEMVWTSAGPQLRAHRIGPAGDVAEVPGFPKDGTAGLDYRTTPTLADLDGDGAFEMLVGARSTVSGVGAQVLVYTYNPQLLEVQEYWTKTLDSEYTMIYASISVGDISNSDPLGEDLIIVCAVGTLGAVPEKTKAYAWDAAGNTFPGWNPAGVMLDIAIDGTQSTGGGSPVASAQPAIADLDGDGTVEIIIGPNVLTVGGDQINAMGALDNATPSLSAAIGDLDGNPANLEFVLGERAYRFDGTVITELIGEGGFPKGNAMAPAVICKMGTAGMVVAASPRGGMLPGVLAYGDQGLMVEGFPKSLYGDTKDDGAPVIGDFDGDRLLDSAAAITDGTYGGVVALWRCSDTEYEAEHNHWPMMGHNVRHTGCYSVPKPNRPSCVLHTPIAGGVTLTWRDRSGVEEYYIVERSATGEPWSFVVIEDTLPPNTESYVDVVSGANFYRIRAGRQDPTSGNEVVSAFAASGDHCSGSPIIAECDACPADLDGDNDVGASDLSILLGAYGPCIGCRADLDCDNDVGASDLAILLGAWGPC